MSNDILIRQETRLCKVKGKHGYFHTWEHYSKPIEASPLVGGAPAEVISQVFGIVEFEVGVQRVQPYDIEFLDETSEFLHFLNEREKEINNDD